MTHLFQQDEDQYIDAPCGESLEGDMKAIYYMMAGLANACADDDNKWCLVRCPHGGYCSLKPNHEGQHDADGHCQWENKS